MNISGVNTGRDDFGWGPSIHLQQMVTPDLDVFRPDAMDCTSSSTLSTTDFTEVPSVAGNNTLLPATSVPVNWSPACVGHVRTEDISVGNDHAAGSAGMDGIGVGSGRGWLGGVFANGRGVAGDAGAGCEPGARRRRGPRRHSWGDDDLEFLRTLVTETESAGTEDDKPPTPPVSSPNLSSPGSQYPCPSPLLVETMLPPVEGTRSSSQTPRLPIVSKSRGVERSLFHTQSAFTTSITEEEKLEAADYVAKLLWRASPCLRDRLLVRVNDSWAKAERDLVAAREAVALGTTTFANLGGPVMSDDLAPIVQSAHQPLKEILMKRLEETRREVEMEVLLEHEAASSGDGVPSVTNGPHWLGIRALRADVREKLMRFQVNARDQKKADIIAKSKDAKARGATKEELVQMLEHARLELSTQALDSGIEPIAYDMKLTEVDIVTEALLQQLNENHKAMIADMTPIEMSSTQLKECLLQRLNATRAAAEAELRAADEAAQVAASRPTLSTLAGVLGISTSASASAPAPDPPVGLGLGVVADGEDVDSNVEVLMTTARNVNPQMEEVIGGSEGVERAGKRRRKSSGGGRRCAHAGCSLHPHFGVERPEYCSSHKLPGMFNVKGRQCSHPDCSRTPVYGKSGDRHPTFCAAHKMADMVDIKNPTCREPSCARQPSFGSPNDRRATYCAKHMLSGMVNVRRQLASRAKSNGVASFARSPEAMVSEAPVVDVGSPSSLTTLESSAPRRCRPPPCS